MGERLELAIIYIAFAKKAKEKLAIGERVTATFHSLFVSGVLDSKVR